MNKVVSVAAWKPADLDLHIFLKEYIRVRQDNGYYKQCPTFWNEEMFCKHMHNLTALIITRTQALIRSVGLKPTCENPRAKYCVDNRKSFCITIIKVSKGAKIRNRYNQVPHLTQDTNGKVTNSQKTPQTRAKRSAFPSRWVYIEPWYLMCSII